jgi:hypothetical protein
MQILITSKTKKGNAACVGGLILANNKLVRLLNPGNWDQYADTDFNIGDIWEIQYTNREDVIPPHIEDIIIHSRHYLRQIDDITNYLLNSGVTIFRGSPIQIFNGRLEWTRNGSGFLENKENLPPNSVGFWISDKELTLNNDGKCYNYPKTSVFTQTKRISYVGFAPKTNVIPQGTLMRISLARWWKPEDSEISERCYLQLSGWYGFSDLIAL